MRFTLLDGGLSTALERAGHNLDHPLWTARMLVDDPEALIAAHTAYLAAGAEVLITSSYQASRPGLAAAGATEPEAVLASATELAREAVHRVGRQALVAASVGPYGAVLADGSEYRGRYRLTHEQLVDFHRERLAVLLASAPDLVAAETLPTAAEAEAVVAALGGSDRPAWFSFTCRDAERTWGGDRIEAAAQAALRHRATIAVGVNCTAPEHVAGLLGRLRDVTDVPLVAYPNRGQRWDGTANRWSGRPRAVTPELVSSWVAAGARYIGGCCGVGPSDIAQLAHWREQL